MSITSARPRHRIAFLVDAILAPYQSRLYLGARRAAARRDVDFVGFFGGYFSGEGQEVARFDGSFIYELAEAPAVDGLVIVANVLSSDVGNDRLLDFCRRRGLPAVAIGELPGIPHVLADNRSGLRAVIDHLIREHGLERLGFIRGSHENPDAIERETVFRERLHRHGLEIREDLIVDGTFLEVDGTRAVRTLLDDRAIDPREIDGIVAASDAMAAGALRELQVRGLRVPQDVAVVGFDDDDHARYASPPLTTVSQPMETVAERAIELLVDGITGKATAPRIVVDTEPIIRRSCGCALLPPPLTVAVPDPRSALEREIEGLRDACRERLRRLLGDPAGSVPPGADELIDELLAALRDHATDRGRLERYVLQTAERGIDLLRWHDVVYLVDGGIQRHRLRDPEGTARCERLLLQIHLMVSQVAARTQSLEQLHTTQRANALRMLGGALVVAKDFVGLNKILTAALPGLDVEYCCVLLFTDPPDRKHVTVAALYDPDEPTSTASRHDTDRLWRATDFLVSLAAETQAGDDDDPESVSTDSLFPPGQHHPNERRSLAIYPLTFARQALGYVVFHEPRHSDRGWIYEGIAGYLSSAVYVIRQAASLRSAREAAEKASAAKSEFLANMSHEIRTPITAVIGYLDLTLGTQLSPRQKHYLEQGLASSRALVGIVNDILDFSKIEARKLEIERAQFLLDEVLDQVVSSCGMAATQKNLELVVDISSDVPDALTGDPLRLGQVLLNLVGNAVKFTEEGEVVFRVEVASMTASETILRFSVRDTGIGIAADQLERLTRPFTQADTSTTRRFGGTGLGLAISQRLIEMMGGSIRVESELGVGSRFWFEVRFPGPPERRGFSSPPARGQLRVLVVDDSASARAALENLLTSQGFLVDSAECGEDALGLLLDGSRRYDLILLDQRLPGLDGLQLARFVSTLPQLAATPAILMAPLDAPELLTAEAEQGAIRAVVAKPIRRRSLLARVSQVLAGVADDANFDGRPGLDPETAATLRGRRVLLVEDNEVNREVASELLQLAGIDVEIATNGQEAVRRTSTSSYDAVLMDLHMPVMDGVQATRTIRANPATERIPVIAMTASVLQEDRRRCLEAGMNDHVSTPITPSRLYTTLAYWMLNGTGETPPASRSQRAALRNATAQRIVSQLAGEGPSTDGALATTAALERISGNVRLYRRLLEKFSEGHQRSPAAIGEALARNDTPAAIHRVHALTGAAANVGAEQVYEVAQRLERALREERIVEARDILVELDAAISRVLPTMAAVIGEGRDTRPPPPQSRP